MDNLSNTTTFITSQQLLYGQSKRRKRNKSSSRISTECEKMFFQEGVGWG